MSQIERAASNDPRVVELLRFHPHVLEVQAGGKPLEFSQGEWNRTIEPSDPEAELFGLVELIDNNPLVCASSFSAPDATASLAQIALGPLVLAGLIQKEPILHFSFAAGSVAAALARLGPSPPPRPTPPFDADFFRGVLIDLVGQHDSEESPKIVGLRAIAYLPPHFGVNDGIGLYEERFGGSFYVRRSPNDVRWRPSDILGKPFALYRIDVAREAINSRALIEVISDVDGKVGAAGIVHAMNVMCGFEESLGLPD